MDSDSEDENLFEENAIEAGNEATYAQNLKDILSDPRVSRIYARLRSMFPQVKNSYVVGLLINLKEQRPEIHYNEEQLLTEFVDTILINGHQHISVNDNNHLQGEPELIISMSIDEQCEYLSGMFPNADPTYLREFVQKNESKEKEFQDFIQENLESPNYPTIQEYFTKIKVTEQIKEYTTGFNVEKFLNIFPDPVNYFENESRISDYQVVALEFLKSFFIRHKVATISKEYKNNNHNISLTAKALSKIDYDMCNKRYCAEFPTDSITLLQEFAYIKHKDEILSFIEHYESTENIVFEELKDKNLLLSCQCCFNDECRPDKCLECNSGHTFCNECLILGANSALGRGETKVECFAHCKSEFSLPTLQKILSPVQFSILLKNRQAAEVEAAGIDGLVTCPFCTFASIPPPNSKIFKCLNPECLKESCRTCKELNHAPFKCNELIDNENDKMRHLIEEKMTEALIRTCQSCRRQFVKEDGCNKMSCICGAIQCYLCDSAAVMYDHFNGQGSNEPGRCPLYTDDRKMEAEGVIAVAKELSHQFKIRNPDFNINIETILPDVPLAKSGPHDQIANANQMAEHVRKLAEAPNIDTALEINLLAPQNNGDYLRG